MKDAIYETLDLTPIVYEGETYSKQEGDNITKEEKDAERARDLLMDVVEVGQKAMRDLSELAYQSQDPKTYTALKDMLDSMTDVSNKILDLQIKKDKIFRKPDGPEKVVNNNTLIMTTEQLNKVLDGIKNND